MTTDLDVICHTSTRERRKVPADVHKEAFTDYGLSFPQAAGAFEVDHLIPLELGGDNVIENLWAEAASPRPGFHEKDHVEDYLHKQVCSGATSLQEAQRIIATDWLSVWKQIGGVGDDGEDNRLIHTARAERSAVEARSKPSRDVEQGRPAYRSIGKDAGLVRAAPMADPRRWPRARPGDQGCGRDTVDDEFVECRLLGAHAEDIFVSDPS
jgi:hypothetical protein